MSSQAVNFDTSTGVVIKLKSDGKGGWKTDHFDANETAVFDAITKKVTVTETYATFKELKTYALNGETYVLESKLHTDLNGAPLGVVPDDHNQDGFDDDDIDHDGSKDDHIVSDGNHKHQGRGGDDIMDGSDDSDSLDGGSGDDDLNGGAGDDRLVGGSGDDDLAGGGDDDLLKGDDGDDSLNGGSGDDSLDGGKGDDDFIAGDDSGNDRYNGGIGDDSIDYSAALAGVSVDLTKGEGKSRGADDAGVGHDKIRGVEDSVGSGFDDLIVGNKGSNHLDGGNGNDLIIGGGKDDHLIGGSGDDTFKFMKVSDSKVGAADTIDDFSAGDLIDLSAIDAMKGGTKNDSFHFVSDPSSIDASNANGAVWFENGVLYASTDGDVEAELQINLSGVVSLDPSSLIL